MAKKRRVTSSKKTTKRGQNVTLTLEEMLNQADEAMEESLDMVKANTLYHRASKVLEERLRENPEVALILSNVLGKLGETKVSMGKQDAARTDFERAIALLNDQDEGSDDVSKVELQEKRASLYMYLGQLSSNDEALQAYNKGVELLVLCIQDRERLEKAKDMDAQDGNEQRNELNELRRQLCGAYCTIAELYMTDLCYAENAEASCETCMQHAMKVIDSPDGKPMVDALQTLASLRISQSRGEEAIDLILNAYGKMKTGCEALAALVGLSETENNGQHLETAVELIEIDAANSLPGFEFRCQTARILLECASICTEEENRPEKANECAKAAIQVLGSLLAENDEVVEPWFLVGCAFAALTPIKTDEAISYLEQALEMLVKVKASIEIMEGEENEELDDIKLRIDDVSCKLKELGWNTETAADVEMEESA